MDSRLATLDDLTVVASWLVSQDDCRFWAGTKVTFPVDLELLPFAIQFEVGESWALVDQANLVAFGQIFPVAERLHFSRLIVDPKLRGKGVGRLLTQHLLSVALSRKPPVISLNVMPDNPNARHLYQSLGFEEATRPNGEPASHPSTVYMVYESTRHAG